MGRGMHVKLRLTDKQHSLLMKHLFPGDGKEAVVLGLCGTSRYCLNSTDGMIVCVHRLEPVPHEACFTRTRHQISWETANVLPDLLREVERSGQVLFKAHSHPEEEIDFSAVDDRADHELFPSVAGWLDTDFPGVSVIVLPNGRMLARGVDSHGSFQGVSSISIAGPTIRYWSNEETAQPVAREFERRTAQVFGEGTVDLLSRLSIGVVGCSGTGSPTIEMLFRLGVRELVLVDGDIVETKNLNRIYNSSVDDVEHCRFKVDVMKDAVLRSGLPTKVASIQSDLFHSDVVRRLAQCDVIFGCMDSIDGRDLLNRLCVSYSIPYFDLGVLIDSDGLGNVNQVCGTVHYLQPDGSSLLSRGVYTAEDLAGSNLRRTDPDGYEEQVRSKYIRGAREDNPAVISVNTLVASLAVNDFLARLHEFRDDPNEEIHSLRVSLTQTRLFYEAEGSPCPALAQHAGQGDTKPLLNMPVLGERAG